jgi:hypothetical protein
MGAIPTIFSGPYAMLARLAVIAIVLVAAFGTGWVKGNAHGTQKLIDYQGKQAVATIALMKERIKVVTEVQTKYVDRIKEIFVKGDTIEKEVVKYVTQIDDSRCAVPVGFVREYDAAWSGTPAGPPAESDRGPSGIPLSGIAEADAHNATSCLALKAQRDGLIEFYKRVQALEK